MKQFKLEKGDCLVVYQDIHNKRLKKYEGEWDVIRVNKKSITLQNWPTYEQRQLKIKNV